MTEFPAPSFRRNAGACRPSWQLSTRKPGVNVFAPSALVKMRNPPDSLTEFGTRQSRFEVGGVVTDPSLKSSKKPAPPLTLPVTRSESTAKLKDCANPRNGTKMRRTKRNIVLEPITCPPDASVHRSRGVWLHLVFPLGFVPGNRGLSPQGVCFTVAANSSSERRFRANCAPGSKVRQVKSGVGLVTH
jgi:hypothetical protein